MGWKVIQAPTASGSNLYHLCVSVNMYDPSTQEAEASASVSFEFEDSLV